MSQKILLAGVVGGIVLFIWGAISHMVLPLGEMGMKKMPNEDAVIAAMRDNMKEPGLYLFPGFDPSANLTKEQEQALNQKWEQGPTGFLVYHPEGMGAMSPKQLVTEVLTDIIAVLLAAFLLSQALGSLKSFGSKVLFVASLGLFAVIVVSVPYWNWYGFPTSFTFSELVDQVVGFGLAGLVLAAMVKQPAV